MSNRPLQNDYLLMRHGQSQANAQELIISAPEVGRIEFGLTEEGIEQVHASVLADADALANVRQILSSDFLRARQTAEIVSQQLDVPVEYSSMLRERGFGDWEGQSNSHYKSVWHHDWLDPTHQIASVESVVGVAERMTQFLLTIDQERTGQTLLIVSHGDPIQILITALRGMDLRHHRDMKPIQTAELRAVRVEG